MLFRSCIRQVERQHGAEPADIANRHQVFAHRPGFESLPDASTAKRVTARALELGLVVLTCGRNADAIRMLPPLTIEDEVLAEGLDLLECALKGVAPA
mgnify:CR=1 FL=1